MFVLGHVGRMSVAVIHPVVCFPMRVHDSTRDVPLRTNQGRNSEQPKEQGSVELEPWQDLSTREKARHIGIHALQISGVIAVIFVYICALGTLNTAFTLLSSRGLGQKIRDSVLIRDPASALIVGMMVTVLLQSSTTFVNVLVSMVAANMITVHMAIPMMIGSELGTSFLNGLISLTYAGDRKMFERAFSAAIIGDVFNLCCVVIVLPLELLTSFIERISWWIVDPLINEQGISFKTLELLTDPITRFILEVDEPGLRNATVNDSLFPGNHSFILKCSFANGTRIYNCPYTHPFIHTTWSDTTVGTIVLLLSITTLVLCLFNIVYLINRIMTGRVKQFVQTLVEKECPHPWEWAAGYTVMAVGMVLTVLVQSNSVFSSSLTPLAGAGVITLEKLYALNLGSNIGTTTSGVLAAMSADPTRFEKALHMAMCQVMYNIVGTLLFYPIPSTRKIPLSIAHSMGKRTAKYRWFVLLYLAVMFVVVPIVVISLSLAPEFVIVFAFIFVLAFILCLALIKQLQRKKPHVLPKRLQSWHFLPVWMRSFKPYDAMITQYCSNLPLVGKYLVNQGEEEEHVEKYNGHVNRVKMESRQTVV